MTYNETEQLTLLASHRAQLAGLEDEIVRMTAAKADGSVPEAVANAAIERFLTFAYAQRCDIEDCLNNLKQGEDVDLPEEPAVPEVEVEAVELPAEDVVEPPVQDVPTGDEAAETEEPHNNKRRGAK